MTKIATFNMRDAIAKKATIFAHVWQMHIILHLCYIALTNLIHDKDNESDGKWEALSIDQVPKAIVL